MFRRIMFIFWTNYSIPRTCWFLLISLWFLSLLIRQMFNLQEIFIPLIPKIRFMSEGTIWLSEDWMVNLSRLMRSLTFFWQFFEALFFWTWTSCSFFFQEEIQHRFCIRFLLRVFRVQRCEYKSRASFGKGLNCVYVINASPRPSQCCAALALSQPGVGSHV